MPISRKLTNELYNFMEYYIVIEKDDILPFATAWMNLENINGIMLSEIGQTERDKHHDFTHMWDLNNKTSE